MPKRQTSTQVTARGGHKSFNRNDSRRSKRNHTNNSLKVCLTAAPASHNINDSNLLSTTDTCSNLTCAELYQAVSSGNPDDVFKLISDRKTTFDQALLMACSEGHKFIVQHLLLKGASIEARDTLGYTPLLISVERGFVDIARLLLDKGADVNSTNKCDDSALTLSVRTCGSKDMIGLLLKRKSVNANHRNKDGYTCWKKAVEALDFDAVKLLIKSGRDINKDRNNFKGITNTKLNTTPEKHSSVCKSFDVDAIISLLEQEAEGYESCLRLAVFQRDLNSTRYLIDYGIFDAGINSESNLLVDFLGDIEKKQYKQSPVIRTELEIIRKLLQTGADVFLKSSSIDALVVAVNIGSYVLVDLLCQHGANPNIQSSKPPHQNAVVAAAGKGRCDLLKVMMNYNADIHYNNGAHYPPYHNSPVEIALQNGEVNVVKLLMRNGVSVNVAAGLLIAVKHKRLHSLTFLVGNFSDTARSAIHNNCLGLFHKAVEVGDIDVINTLLDLGSDVNCVFEERTPLMNAGTPEVVELLIKRGAEVNEQTDNGNQINILSYIILKKLNTEMHRDLKRVQDEKDEFLSPHAPLRHMVEILLRSGARVDKTDSCGQTPLMVASKKSGAGDVLKTLLEAGAEVNKADINGFSALHEAVKVGFLKNVDILIEFGADVNQKSNDGCTALHRAVRNESVLTFLLLNGADIHAQDESGNTALLIAAKSNHNSSARVLQILLDAQSNVNHRNSEGETALMKAAFVLNDGAMKTLCEARADVNIRNIGNTKDVVSILVDRMCETHKTHGEVRDSILYLLDRGGSSSCVSLHNLYYFIYNGCLTIVQRLVEAGLGPSDTDTVGILLRPLGLLSSKQVSPFCFALLCNEVKLARYFSDVWYLTNSDVSSLAHQLRLTCKNQLESLEFLDDFLSQPMSLQKLCFVAVSTSIGTGPDRENKVRDLPLPNMLKNKLRFSPGCSPELRLDNDQLDMLLLPDRLNHLVLGDLFYDSDDSDYKLDYDYNYENSFDYGYDFNNEYDLY